MATTSSNLVSILCCMCGVPIAPNPSNSCASCLAANSDVTKGISTEVTLHQCRGCQRWHQETDKWLACDLESRELMTLCLSKVSGLKGTNHEKIKLVDASWVWTEPHSMRLKTRLTIQRQVESGGTILQQSFIATFIVRNQQCIECQAEFRTGSWKSVVQVRQRVQHKRTFLFLEQLILKNEAHRGCLNIETFQDGMDFYFADKGKAARFISFLEDSVPIRVKTSKKLIGTDVKSNVANYKFTNLVEICPLCKDDLLYLPKKLAQNMGNINRCVLVKNVSNLIHVVDPSSGQTASFSAEVFWRDPFRPIITSARGRLTEFMVLGKEAIHIKVDASKKSTAKQRNKLALVTVAKEEDLGVNDKEFEERSHIGYLLKAGDVCAGYDLKDTQLVDDEATRAHEDGKIPDVVLVRKLYGAGGEEENKSSNKRIFKIQRLAADRVENQNAKAARKEMENDAMDEEEFLQEIETDKEMRARMNVYKSDHVKNTKTMETVVDENDDDEEEDDQQVRLDELLDELVLEEQPKEEMLVNQEEVLYEEGERAKKDGIGFITQMEARNMQQKDVATTVEMFSAINDTFGGQTNASSSHKKRAR